MHPTIVLIHGAFADSSSWDGVIDQLVGEDRKVVAAANPLRGMASDAYAVSDLVRTIEGPVVLAAHSYGGAVMSNVDPDAGDIVGVVYCNGFAPDAGENAFQLAAMFPGSTLDETSAKPVPLGDGTTDLYIKQERFNELFCADLPVWQAERMAVTQRPATQEALTESSGERPLWKEIPSWFLIGEKDLIIPAALQHFMAERAGARRTIEVPGASHAITVSQPEATAQLILEAAALHVAA
jgi:pimeloyl-ACP methyl ester carboxylesterase